MGPQRIITIDGPAGAGKSTLGRRLAQSLGFLYLDSGALYRAVAWRGLSLGLDLENSDSLKEFLENFRPEVAADAHGFRLLIDGADITEELRSAAVSQAASRVAVQPWVRHWVQERLRYLGQNGGVVAEGRDQGTVVFPEAEWKFYLYASLEVRARRRRQDWRQDGDPPPLAEIMAEVTARDRRDETRDEAPLRVAPEALVIDTTDLTVDEVVEKCLARIRQVSGN